MIKKFIITGDTHGQVDTRLCNIARNTEYAPGETAVIILGDAGVNFYCNKSEKKRKHQLSKYYNNAYQTWVIRDVTKRNIAKQNKLNYHEIFSIKFAEIIEIILNLLN